MRQNLSYLEAANYDVDRVISDWERRFDLPAKDRRMGKEILRQITTETKELPLPLLPSASGKNRTPLSRIYIEEPVQNHPRTASLLGKFQGLPVETITHHKDVFNRTFGKNPGRSLILAEKTAPFLYPGAPVCQDFGNKHFYYTSVVRNCVYDCDYCFLRGMYPSDDLVVFVNLEDTFDAVDQVLTEHPVYLCVSYDTDLLALEGMTGFVKTWSEFAAARQALSIEIRTKCAEVSAFERLAPSEHVIFAYTLSPEPIARAFEHGVPSLEKRLLAIQTALDKGFPVRLCFDPLLFAADYEKIYDEFLTQVREAIDLSLVRDFSVGTFRISKDYLKALRHRAPNSPIAQYPYENQGGVACYPEAIDAGLTDFFVEKLVKFVDKNRIFWWKSQNGCDKVVK